MTTPGPPGPTQATVPRPAEDLTIVVDGHKIDGPRHDAATIWDGAVGHISTPGDVYLGASMEDPWGDQRPTEHDLRVGYRGLGYDALFEHHGTGWRQGIADQSAVTYEQQMTYTDGVGPEMPNDREWIADSRRPWDHELHIVRRGQPFRV